MIGILFSVFSSLMKSLEKLGHRYILVNEDSLSYAFLFNLLSSLVLIPLMVLEFQLPTNPIHYLLVLASSILWAIVAYFGFKSYSKLDVTLKVLFGESKLLFVFFLSVIFLREVITLTKFLGVFIVFTGMIIISHKKGEKFGMLSQKGVVYSLLSSLFTAFAIMVDKLSQDYFTAGMFSFLVYFLPALILLPFVFRKKEEFKSIVSNSWLPMIITVTLSSASYFFMLKAFQLVSATVVYTIIRSSIIFTILGGFIFLKERKDFWKRLFVGELMLVGVLILLM